jgi:hypothetical protein
VTSRWKRCSLTVKETEVLNKEHSNKERHGTMMIRVDDLDEEHSQKE